MNASINNKPQICFGHVYHQRLRPVKHAFTYGVYFIRLPMRTLAETPMKSRLFSHNRFNLLAFHDKDHGDNQGCLLEWIDNLLQSQGIDDAKGEIWLQTFPRVLGYVFNPISFWFCHRADGALRAIVCEVNNTFGERHCYLLEAGSFIGENVELNAHKVFHVSPFCEVKGFYRFQFSKLIQKNGESISQHFSAKINYNDDFGVLLKTGISGTAYELSIVTILRAFFTYPLMTLNVIARIHWQALRLWIKRVPFFSKPLPSTNKLSR